MGDASPSLGRRPSALFHSSEYVLVDKPANYYIDGDHTESVSGFVAETFGSDLPEGVSRPWLCHQLDMPTSGCMLLGLTKAATAAATREFSSRRVGKAYLALCAGVVGELGAEFDWKWPVGDDLEDPLKFRMSISATNAKAASTHAVVIATGPSPHLGDELVSLLFLRPATGRRHQLRLHCATAGHPIVGDLTYGPERDARVRALLEAPFPPSQPQQIPRLYLHAWLVSFPVLRAAGRFASLVYEADPSEVLRPLEGDAARVRACLAREKEGFTGEMDAIMRSHGKV